MSILAAKDKAVVNLKEISREKVANAEQSYELP
jgi:hypothetical protein